MNGVLGTAYKELGIKEEENHGSNDNPETAKHGADGEEGAESAGSVADGKS